MAGRKLGHDVVRERLRGSWSSSRKEAARKSDLVGIHSISLAARCRLAACSSTLSRGLEKIGTARGHNCSPLFALSLSFGKKNFLFLPWLSTLRMHMMLFVGWTVMTHLMKFHKTKSRKLPLGYFWTNSIDKTLPDLFLAVPRESWDRSVDTELPTSCST